MNEGNSKYWDNGFKNYVESKKAEGASLRYVGSMVADVHRTLLYGGTFMYPKDQKSKKGKLRMLYECIPLSWVIEKAGGKSINGKKRILDI